MAATIQNQDKEAKIIRFPRPFRAIENRDEQHRLPELSSAQIEDFFAHAAKRDTKTKIAA